MAELELPKSVNLPLSETQSIRRETIRLTLIHSIEALMSAASNLLTIGVFFFMQHKFGWDLKRNFILSASLGTVYIVGALCAGRISGMLGRRGGLAAAYGVIAVTTLITALHTTPVVATATILLFAFSSATTWPVIENLVSSGAPNPHVLSRRLAVYNIVWAAVGAIVVAANGFVIENFSIGVFLIPTAVACASMIISIFCTIEPTAEQELSDAKHAHAAPPAEPALAKQRVVALWLSRICVPAMYLMIYSLSAMFPSLPVLQSLSPTMQTLVSSVWLVVRFLAFVLLGATVFWHTRPRILLVAAAMLLVSLLMMTVRPGDIGLPNSLTIDLASMIAGQILFGIATGLIYTASLYFGMVLSEGSTEHGGYHEALIGLGMMLGPTVGAATQFRWPGNQTSAIVAISGLIGISILLAAFASLRMGRRAG